MNKQNKKSLGLLLLGLFAISGLILGATVVAAQTQHNDHTMTDGTIMGSGDMSATQNEDTDPMMGSGGMQHMMGGKVNDKQHQQMHKQCMKMMEDEDFNTMHQTTDTKQ